MILDESQARTLIEKVLSLATADEVRVNLRGGRRANTRFALNSVTTCGDAEQLQVTVTAYLGRRHAAATTTGTDEQSLRRVVAAAEALARLAPEDPEYVPELGPQEYLPVEPWSDRTASAGPDARAEAVAAALDCAAETNLEASGYYEHGAGFSAVGNSRGLFGWSRRSDASLTVTMRADGGASSGWAGRTARDLGDIDGRALACRAAEKALAARNPRPLEPGVYPVILEPQAAWDFLWFGLRSLDARRADEGRSFFTRPGGGSKIGLPVAGENITLRSDPTHPDVLAPRFFDDGLPARPRTWIEHGVLKNLPYSRFWAEKQQAEPTGPPTGLILEGGEGAVEDLIAAADRAVLVTRFWYIRYVDPQTLLLTGLTRDGLFWVENGRIAHGLRNFRFNESPMAVLNKVTGLSAPQPVGGALVPALAAEEFTFASVSESV